MAALCRVHRLLIVKAVLHLEARRRLRSVAICQEMGPSLGGAAVTSPPASTQTGGLLYAGSHAPGTQHGAGSPAAGASTITQQRVAIGATSTSSAFAAFAPGRLSPFQVSSF